MMSRESLAQILAQLRDQHGDLDIINFTGGEPTLHPDLVELLRMSSEAGIRRLTVSSNGLRLADEEYVKALAEVNARIVLSLDTFSDEVDKVMLGATTVKTKLRGPGAARAVLAVTTTILPAVAKGLNDADVGRLWQLVVEKKNVGFARAPHADIYGARRRELPARGSHARCLICTGCWRLRRRARSSANDFVAVAVGPSALLLDFAMC